MRIDFKTTDGSNVRIDGRHIYLLMQHEISPSIADKWFVCSVHTDLMWRVDQAVFNEIEGILDTRTMIV